MWARRDGRIPVVADDFTPNRALRKHMASVRRRNRSAWRRAMHALPISRNSELRVRGNFGVANQSERDRLVAVLTDHDYLIINEDSLDRFVEIVFEVPSRSWTLEQVDEWSDTMFQLAGSGSAAVFGGLIEVIPALSGTDLEKAQQRVLNRATWKALQQRGVDEHTPISLDANFWALDRAGVNRLEMRMARDSNYVVHLSGPARRRMIGPRQWSLTATRPAQTTTRDGIDIWTDRMIDLAHHTGTDFDGWGALLPD
jgi:hypothetical protein